MVPDGTWNQNFSPVDAEVNSSHWARSLWRASSSSRICPSSCSWDPSDGPGAGEPAWGAPVATLDTGAATGVGGWGPGAKRAGDGARASTAGCTALCSRMLKISSSDNGNMVKTTEAIAQQDARDDAGPKMLLEKNTIYAIYVISRM